MVLTGTLFACNLALDAQSSSIASSLQHAYALTGKPAPASKVEFITVDELKSKIAKNEPVTIIDVRSSEAFAGSATTIKGSIHFKLRRLRSRLSFPPLKDLPRDREIAIYCSCPNDEASIRAAEVLMGGGFTRVRALKGGWVAWMNARGQVEDRIRR
jgi:rhodanese-related sulfurtransferase